MGLEFRPSLRPATEAQSAISIEEFDINIRLLTLSRRILISTRDCMCMCRMESATSKMQIFRVNSSIYARNYDIKSLLTSLFGGTIFTSQERAKLTELKSNPDVRTLPTDPATMSTDWGSDLYHILKWFARELVP